MTYTYAINAISGIWNSYGCPPEEGSGISLSIEDVSGSASLKQLVGFDKDESNKDIGLIRDRNSINELVVMLPMVDEKPTQEDDPFFIPFPQQPVAIDPCECQDDPCGHSGLSGVRRRKSVPKQDNTGMVYSNTERAWLFAIDTNIINKIFDADYKTMTMHQLKQKFIERYSFLNKDNSVVKLILSMLFFNIPPHLNWLLYNGFGGKKFIPPIAMYTQDFSLDLYKEDLSDIWQGVAPSVVKNPSPEPDEITLEYSLSGEELLANYDLSKFNDIKMRIFKCKFRSDGTYDDLIEGRITEKTDDRWYGYNWPYDNCSIVEYLQVQAGEIREFDEQKVISGSVLANTSTTQPVYYNSPDQNIPSINDPLYNGRDY